MAIRMALVRSWVRRDDYSPRRVAGDKQWPKLVVDDNQRSNSSIRGATGAAPRPYVLLVGVSAAVRVVCCNGIVRGPVNRTGIGPAQKKNAQASAKLEERLLATIFSISISPE